MTVQETLDQKFIGYEVSTGTLDEFDLIGSYHEFLKEHYEGYDPSWEYDMVKALIDFENLITWDSEIGGCFQLTTQGRMTLTEFVNETLPDMINELAPKGHYFGSNIGSSANIGFWPNADFDFFFTE